MHGQVRIDRATGGRIYSTAKRRKKLSGKIKKTSVMSIKKVLVWQGISEIYTQINLFKQEVACL